MDENGRPLTAKEKRQEQLKCWQNSSTNAESGKILNLKPKVKFNDGAVFLAACSSGDLEELKSLLNKGANINFANIDGLTALHTACIDCKLEVVSFLVDNGASIDQEDNEGWTPLHATASCGFMDIARYLIEKGANVVAVNSEGEIPLDIAEEDDMIEYLQQQIQSQGLDIDVARNQERELMVSDAQQQLKSVLSGEKLTVLVHPNSGASALHVAAAKGYNDVIRLLLNSGMNINMKDNDGWTPLHAAAHWSQQESAKLLSDQGASFSIKNKLGQTAFDVADEDMLEYLDDLKTHQTQIKEEYSDNSTIINNNCNEDIINNFENDSTKLQNRNRRSSREIATSSDEDDSTSSSEISSSRLTRTKPPEKQGKFDDITNQRKSPGFNQTDISEIFSTNTEKKIKQSASVGNVSNLKGLHSENRPASLHLSSSASTSKGTSKNIQTTKDFTANKSSTQSSISKSSNGPPLTPSTPNERNSNIKEAAPSTWRTGLRKTGSFDDKMRAIQRPIGTSNYTSSRTSESGSPTKLQDTLKTARVAPIPVIDARTNKTKPKGETSEDIFNFQRTNSYKKHDTETTPSIDSLSYKRSTTNTKEDKPEPTTTKPHLAAQISNDSPDRRRSFLQPVRDEEAEAQRKARSRRERQSRRSTQGVTLDVYEEAKRQIDTMKTEKAAAAAAAASNAMETSESNISHNDSSSNLYRRLGDQTSSDLTSTTSQPTKSSVVLPSGYIPSSERVKNSAKTLSVPSISIQNEETNTIENNKSDDNVDEETNQLTPAVQSPSVRKTAAQQKRRQRKERRSTGLPGLKPSEANNVDNQSDDELFGANDNKNNDRLREPVSGLESSVKRRGLRGSASDIPAKTSASIFENKIKHEKDYKKMYEEKCLDYDRLQEELEKVKRERRMLEKDLADMEKELMKTEQKEALRLKNQVIKQENLALSRLLNQSSVKDDLSEQDSSELSDDFSTSQIKTDQKSKNYNKIYEKPNFNSQNYGQSNIRSNFEKSNFKDDLEICNESDNADLFKKEKDNMGFSKSKRISNPSKINKDISDHNYDFQNRRSSSSKNISKMYSPDVLDKSSDDFRSIFPRKKSTDFTDKNKKNTSESQDKSKYYENNDESNTSYIKKSPSNDSLATDDNVATTDSQKVENNLTSEDWDPIRPHSYTKYDVGKYPSRRYSPSYNSTESTFSSGLPTRRGSSSLASIYEPSTDRIRNTDRSSRYSPANYNSSLSYSSDRKPSPLSSTSPSLYHTIPIPSKSQYKKKLGLTTSLGSSRLSPVSQRASSSSSSMAGFKSGGSRTRDVLNRNPISYTSSASSKRVGNLMNTYRNQYQNP